VADTDGTISAVTVFVNGVSIGAATITSGNWTIAWTPSLQGIASVSAIAADDRGNASFAAGSVVNITDSTSPAVVVSVSPGTATLPSGATRYVNAAVTPAAGRAIVRVEYFVSD